MSLSEKLKHIFEDSHYTRISTRTKILSQILGLATSTIFFYEALSRAICLDKWTAKSFL